MNANGFSIGPVGVRILEDEAAMGRVTASHVSQRLKQMSSAGRDPVLWCMAAPSAFAFYRALAGMAAADPDLAGILRRTHFFQFDDYPFARNTAPFAATFRNLLETHFFGPLAQACGRLSHIHLMELEGGTGDRQIAGDYFAALMALQAKGAFLLQLKGIGMDGHWGFHGAETPLDAPAAILEVPIGPANAHQQMRDWPALFPDRSSLPTRAYTFDVSAFLMADEIIDNVPQAAKEYAVLGVYGSEAVIPQLPSSAIKRHRHATTYLTKASAAALLEFRAARQTDPGALLAPGTLERLRGLWRDPDMPGLEAENIRSMEMALRALEFI